MCFQFLKRDRCLGGLTPRQVLAEQLVVCMIYCQIDIVMNRSKYSSGVALCEIGRFGPETPLNGSDVGGLGSSSVIQAK